MKTVCVMNHKGGVGKTTLTLALSQSLAKRGYKVLLVDMDGQKNLTFLATGEDDHTENALTLMQAKESFSPLTMGERLAIVPGSSELYVRKFSIDKLGKALFAYRNDFDFCFIDTPPALGSASIASAIASDFVLIPCLADMFSVKAFRSVLESVQTVKKANPSLKVLGVVLVRYTARMTISQGVAVAIQTLANDAGTYLFKTRINESNDYRKAQLLRKSVLEMSGKASKDISELTDEFLTLLEND